jgi:hypothetical protein
LFRVGADKSAAVPKRRLTSILVCVGFVVPRHANGQSIETIKEHDANNYQGDCHILRRCGHVTPLIRFYENDGMDARRVSAT